MNIKQGILKMPIPVATTREMSARFFDKIRQIVYEKSGIALNESKDSLVKARIAKRMKTIGIDSYEEYLVRITNDSTGMEVQHLLDAISTNTTSFYREAEHFQWLRKIVKEWMDAGQRKLRIWSAACSSGEEPYTIAIELLETFGSMRMDAKILATDIAPSVLVAAQRGEYSHKRVEPVPRELLNKYFTRIERGEDVSYMAKDELKRMILFRQFNLSKPPYPLKNPLDIIFCRNVMIYFDNRLRAKLAVEFERLLRPGGYLMIGHSETISGMTTMLRCIKPSIYIKE